ncbi:MAG: zinc-binding dehydrogenase [Gemmatimonadota bacterium]
MKAATIHAFGDFDVLTYEDVETPRPGPGEVLIKVLASGVNRFDHYIRAGEVAPELPFPHILGADAAGEVAALGDGVEGFRIGERVIPLSGFPTDADEQDVVPATSAPSFTVQGLGVPGTYAQYITVPVRFVLRDETGLSPEEAAALPMGLATGVRAVKVVGGVKAGDRVLVQAGAGSAGSMMIQVAKALGARVATTVRKEAKRAQLEELGADLVINSGTQDVVAEVKEWTGGAGADVVIDTLGGDVLQHSIDAARPFGVIVAYGFVAGVESTINVQSFFFTQKQLRGSMSADLSDLEWGLEQVRAGRIRPVLDSAYPLSEAAEAQRKVAENRVTGSVVLRPWA